MSKKSASSWGLCNDSDCEEEGCKLEKYDGTAAAAGGSGAAAASGDTTVAVRGCRK